MGNGGNEWEEMKGRNGKWGGGTGGNERACWEMGVGMGGSGWPCWEMGMRMGGNERACWEMGARNGRKWMGEGKKWWEGRTWGNGDGKGSTNWRIRKERGRRGNGNGEEIIGRWKMDI
jgi:hypothetical protein